MKTDRNKEYIELTKNCGDCGRRFKWKFAIPTFNFKTKKGRNEVMKFAEFCFPDGNIACQKCSDEHMDEILNKKRRKK